MAWRTIVITNPATLTVENDQLVITQFEPITFPIEDIAALVLESPQVILSSALLDRLAQHEVMLFACDRRHLPSMACYPFVRHSRLAKIQRLQLAMSQPFRKRCWQSIVRQKVANQAACLEYAGCEESGVLAAMVDRITSGDATNIESVAAREHFLRLFGRGFERGAEDPINCALNYGYAIQRAAVARALTMYGFLPAHGIHHHSELNQFNLADDFMEPLRPLVDLHVALSPPESELTKINRQLLVGLLYAEVVIANKRQSALRASEIMAASFVAACRENDPRLLKLPRLLPIKMHAYE